LSKIYVVTEGDYSDYHIEACFSTKKKAQEYIKNAKKVNESWYYPDIEEWELDSNSDIVDVIYLTFTFTSPLSKRTYEEKIETTIDQRVRSQVYKYCNKIDFYGFDFNMLRITEVANPNKTIKEEIARLTKVAYDTAKKINYLYKVENIKTLEGIRKRLEG